MSPTPKSADSSPPGPGAEERPAPADTIANAAKDLRYAASMAMAAGMANPVGAAIRNSFAQAEASGHAGDYVGALSDLTAALNGLDLAAAVAKG